MKKIMLMGKTGCGKTSLNQRLNNIECNYKKTQAMDYCGSVLDTPGEYIENKNYYSALIISSYECDIIGLVQSVEEEECIFPPNFTSVFNKEVIGIITKIDLKEDTSKAEEYLNTAGANKIFKISALNNEGIDILKLYLED